MRDDGLVLRTADEAETQRLAARLAGCLVPGDSVALVGELGAGKTRFVEGACRALGYCGRVRSPSFTLLNIYRGRCPILHFDLYRLDPEDAAGLEELEEIEGGGSISFIEWADRLGGDLPPGCLHVTIDHQGGTDRRVTLRLPGARAEAFARALVCAEGE